MYLFCIIIYINTIFFNYNCIYFFIRYLYF
nr:MAG TPA: hypothetical protein [Bacteriophage sp.]DAJ84430.1 MAG TPA: hypothetical protein [Bacteriophage sp.]DAO29665.1 MAG TPA: hypothetical protein [Bacteriophage sp.]